MKRWVIVILAAVCFVNASISLPAAGKPTEIPAKEKGVAKAKGKPFRGKLKIVDQKSRTIVLTGAKAQTFLITAESRITKEGRPATLADLSVDELVSGYARQTSDGKWEARSIYSGKKAAELKK